MTGREEPALTGFTLAAVSIAVGVSIGAATTVGVTLAVTDRPAAPAPPSPAPSGPYLVQYGDRCFHGHCLPCASRQECLDELPPQLRP